jgi:hypothetical protein
MTRASTVLLIRFFVFIFMSSFFVEFSHQGLSFALQLTPRI